MKTFLLGLAVLCCFTSSAAAATFTWSGLGGDAYINTPANWVGGVAPNFLAASGATSDSLVFTGTANTNILIPSSLLYNPTNAIINLQSITFDANAGAFTFSPDPNLPPPATGVNSFILTLANQANGGVLANNSPNVQTFTGQLRDRSSATVNATNAGFIVNGSWNIGTGSSNRGPLTLAGNFDTTINSISGGTGIDGGAANLIKNGNGRLYLLADGIRSSGPNGFWNGQIYINSGAVRIQSNHGLGAGFADETGTNPAVSGRTSIAGGANTGFLELTNNVTVSEKLFLGTRTGGTNLSPHIVNVSGNNMLTGPIEASTGGSNITIQSDGTAASDLLTVAGNLTISAGSTSTRTLYLRGAGNGVLSGDLVPLAGGSQWRLYKEDAGTWTISSSNNTSTGTTVIFNGTLALAGAGSIANSSSIDVQSGATFDVSGVTGANWTLGGTQTLKGGGTVLGNVTTSTGSVLAPGSTVGTLSIGTVASPANLTLAGGDTLQFELSNSPSGTNDVFVVHGDLNLNGIAAKTTIGITPVNSILGSGFYPLIKYDGTLTGGVDNLEYNNSVTGTRQTFALSTTTVPKQVTLNVTGDAKHLTWSGGQNANTWDLISTQNWKEVNPNDQKFYNADFVKFNDTGNNATPVMLSGSVAPIDVIFENNSKNFRFEGDGSLTGPTDLTLSGTGKVTFANTGANDFMGTIALNSGTLAFDRTDNATVANQITGTGSLRQEGTGVLSLAGDNSGFSGTITVESGSTLQAATGKALGAGTTIIENGGTFDANGLDLRPAANAVISAAGSGVGGLGAIVDARLLDGTTRAEVASVVLADHTTVGVYSAGNYLDIWKLQGNNKDLTKTGPGKVDLVNLGDTGLGNIYVNQGDLSIETGTTLGNEDGGQKVYLSGGASLSLWSSTPAHTKPIEVAASGGSIITGNGNNRFDSPITLNGDLTVAGTAGSMWFSGALTGAGGLVKSDSRTLYLESDNNTYAGVTTINGGNITVGANGLTGSIGPNNVVVNTGGTLRFLKATTYSVNNQISGEGGVNYDAAAGVAIVNGDNSYNGATLVNAGTVVPNHVNAFGSTMGGTTIGALNTPSNNATVALAGGITLAENFILNGRSQTGASYAADTNYTPHLLNSSGYNTLTGAITIATTGSAANHINLRSDSGLLKLDSFQLDGTGSGGRRLHLYGAGDGEIVSPLTGSFRIIKHGTGTWTLSNYSMMGGDVWIQKGTLALSANGSLPSVSAIVLYNPDAVFDVTAASASYPYDLGGAAPNVIGIGTIKGNLTASTTVFSPSGTGSVYNLVGGTMTLQGNLSVANYTTFKFKLGNDDASAQNDKINISGTLDVGYSNTPITIIPSTSLETNGSYTLISAGAITYSTDTPFFLDTAHNTRYNSMTLDWSVPGQLKLNVGSDTNKSLTWTGATADWDVKGSYNWKDAAEVSEQFYQADAVRFDDSVTGAIIAVNLPVGYYYPASITVDSAQDYSFNGTGTISSDASIVKRGTGKLTYNAAGNYTGLVSIEGGTFVCGSATALGSNAQNTPGVLINGGTLEMNGKFDRFEKLSIQGAGVGGNGALINSTATTNVQRVHYVTLTGDATFGGTQPFSIENNSDSSVGLAAASYLHGNNHALTKVGANTISLVNLGETGLGDIHFDSGRIVLLGDTTLGNNNYQLTFANGSRLSFLDSTVVHAKPIIVDTTGGRLDLVSGTTTLTSPITVNGNLSVTANADLTMTLNGVVSGSGGLNKGNPGKVVLAAANTYEGTTVITTGTLELAATGQISPLSAITNDAVFQVAGGTHALGAIGGTGTMNVFGSSVVTATSITQGTLSIGGAAPTAVAAVPEPATWTLLLVGLLAIAGIRQFRQR